MGFLQTDNMLRDMTESGAISNYFMALMSLLQHPGCVCSPDTQHKLCLQSRITDLGVFCVGTHVLDLLLIR